MKILDIPQAGKLGLVVSQNGRYGQIRRSLVMPSNPQTAAQMRVREIFAANASAWDALTEAQRAAWIVAAAQYQTKTHCGTSGPLTGLQFYQKVNATLKLSGQENVDSPPSTPVFASLAPQALVISNTGGVIALSLTVPTSPGTNTVISACAPVKAGQAINANYRVIGNCPTPAAGKSAITDLYVATFGAPATGTKVFVKAHLMVNGFKSVARSFNAIVPASA